MSDSSWPYLAGRCKLVREGEKHGFNLTCLTILCKLKDQKTLRAMECLFLNAKSFSKVNFL